VTWRPATTRRCSVIGLVRAGRCVLVVFVAPGEEGRANLAEKQHFFGVLAEGENKAKKDKFMAKEKEIS